MESTEEETKKAYEKESERALRDRALILARDFGKQTAKELIAEAKVLYNYLKNG